MSDLLLYALLVLCGCGLVTVSSGLRGAKDDPPHHISGTNTDHSVLTENKQSATTISLLSWGSPWEGHGDKPAKQFKYEGHKRQLQLNFFWTRLGGDIVGETASDKFGMRVALSSYGSVLAVGAPKNDRTSGSNGGHVRVYKYVNNAWSQLGSDIDGEAASPAMVPCWELGQQPIPPPLVDLPDMFEFTNT
jgi:hypothetical protein